MDNNEKRFKQLGLNISYHRKMKNISQEALAERAHLSRSHLSRIEAPNMEMSISMNAFFNIADALEIEPKDLLDFSKN